MAGVVGYRKRMAALFGSAGTGRPRMVGLPIGAPAFVAKVLPIGLLASPLRNGLAVCDFRTCFTSAEDTAHPVICDGTPRRSLIVNVSPQLAGRTLLKPGPKRLSRDPLDWLVPPPRCEGHLESVWSVRRRGERTDA
jgi:hypothetical protein